MKLLNKFNHGTLVKFSQFDIKVNFVGKQLFWLIPLFLFQTAKHDQESAFFLQSKVALLPSESYTVGDLKGEILSLKGLLLNR